MFESLKFDCILPGKECFVCRKLQKVYIGEWGGRGVCVCVGGVGVHFKRTPVKCHTMYVLI